MQTCCLKGHRGQIASTGDACRAYAQLLDRHSKAEGKMDTHLVDCNLDEIQEQLESAEEETATASQHVALLITSSNPEMQLTDPQSNSVTHGVDASLSSSSISRAASAMLGVKRLLKRVESSRQRIDESKKQELVNKMGELEHKLLHLRENWSQLFLQSVQKWVRARGVLSDLRVDRLAQTVEGLLKTQSSHKQNQAEHGQQVKNFALDLDALTSQVQALEASGQHLCEKDFTATASRKQIEAQVRSNHEKITKLQMEAAMLKTTDRIQDEPPSLESVRPDSELLAALILKVEVLETKAASADAFRLHQEKMINNMLSHVAEHEQRQSSLSKQLADAESKLANITGIFEAQVPELLLRIQRIEHKPHLPTLLKAKEIFEPACTLTRAVQRAAKLWKESTTATTTEAGQLRAEAISKAVDAARYWVESRWNFYNQVNQQLYGSFQKETLAQRSKGGESVDSGGSPRLLEKQTSVQAVISMCAMQTDSLAASHSLFSLIGLALGHVQALLDKSDLPRDEAALLLKATIAGVTNRLKESNSIFMDFASLEEAMMAVTISELPGVTASDATALGRVACVACSRPASSVAAESRPISRTLRSGSPDSASTPPRHAGRPQSAAPVLMQHRADFPRNSPPTSPPSQADMLFSMGGGFKVAQNRARGSHSMHSSPSIAEQAHADEAKERPSRPVSAHFDSTGRAFTHKALPAGRIRHMARLPGQTGMTLQQGERVNKYGGVQSRQHGGVHVASGIQTGIEMPHIASPPVNDSFSLPTIWTAGQLPIPDADRVHRQHDAVILSNADVRFHPPTGLLKSSPVSPVKWQARTAAGSSGLGKVTGWMASSEADD
jgi:hypothetical protein